MKQDNKIKATFSQAVSRTLELIDRNADHTGKKKTTIEITVTGSSQESLKIEVENLNEVLKMFRLNKD